LYNKKKEGK